MKTASTRNLLAILACGLAASLFCAPRAHAQSEESELPPARGEFEAEPLPPPEQPFLVPDVPHSFAERFQMREHWVTLKIGASAVFDYAASTCHPPPATDVVLAQGPMAAGKGFGDSLETQ